MGASDQSQAMPLSQRASDLSARGDAPGAPWAVLFCAIGLLVTLTPVYIATFPVLLKAMQPEFGNERTGLTLGYSLLMASLAISGPFTGRLVDRLGQRRVLSVGIPAFAATVALFAAIPTSLPAYIGLCVILGAVGSLTYQFVYYSILPHWFDRRLGLALGLAGAGVSLGMAIMPVYADFLLGRFGWRQTYLLLAATALAVGVANLLTMRDPPSRWSRLGAPHADDTPVDGTPFGAVLRTASFWQLAASYLLLCLMINGNVVHLVPMLTDRGVDSSSAAGQMFILGVASFVGRLGCGVLLLGANLNAARLGAAIFLIGAAGAAILITAADIRVIAFAVMLVGLALGVEGELLNFMARKIFGLKAHGAVLGALSAAFLIGALAGPLLLSFVHDMTGAYAPMQITLVAAGVAAAVLHFLTPYPSPTAREGEAGC